MKYIPRQKKITLFLILKDGKIVKVEKNKLFRKLGVHSIIRLPKEDFVHLKGVSTFLTHFNLQKTNHKKGRKYALVLIVKQGFFDGKTQVLPVLRVDNAVIAECLDVREEVSYKELTDKDFKYSFEHIKSVPELKQAILRRYRKSLPHLFKEELFSLGVCITDLKIMKIIKIIKDNKNNWKKIKL